VGRLGNKNGILPVLPHGSEIQSGYLFTPQGRRVSHSQTEPGQGRLKLSLRIFRIGIPVFIQQYHTVQQLVYHQHSIRDPDVANPAMAPLHEASKPVAVGRAIGKECRSPRVNIHRGITCPSRNCMHKVQVVAPQTPHHLILNGGRINALVDCMRSMQASFIPNESSKGYGPLPGYRSSTPNISVRPITPLLNLPRLALTIPDSLAIAHPDSPSGYAL
jgi:hypothetical protein